MSTALAPRILATPDGWHRLDGRWHLVRGGELTAAVWRAGSGWRWSAGDLEGVAGGWGAALALAEMAAR